MNASEFFDAKEVAQEASKAYMNGSKKYEAIDPSESCSISIELTDYSVFLTAYDRNTGLTCQDESELEEAVEDTYIQLI